MPTPRANAARLARREPTGGAYSRRGRRQRTWNWRRRQGRLCGELACAADEWYFVDARVEACAAPPVLDVGFACGAQALSRASVPLHALAADGRCIGWIKTPPHADRLHVALSPEASCPLLRLDLHPVDDVCGVGHPAANTPRWSLGAPGAAPAAVLLPPALAALGDWLDPRARIEPLDGELLEPARLSGRRAVIVLDVGAAPLGWRDLRAMMRHARVVIDLGTAAAALSAGGEVRLAARGRAWRAGVPAARVVEACAATRGFALEDAFPCAWLGERGRFAVRTLGGARTWKRLADRFGLTALLTLSSPDGKGEHETVAAASRAGDLVVTDLPWMLAGRFGPLLAPRVAAHALRAMLGLAVADAAHFWTASADPDLMVRDAADLARRYPPLRPVRWRDGADGVHRLGVTWAPPGAARGHVMLHTGRADVCGRSIPPESMMVWLRRLCSAGGDGDRRVVEAVTWQFDTAAGAGYVPLFDSAAALPAEAATRHVAIVPAGTEGLAGCDAVIECRTPVGLLGDGSLELQIELDQALSDILRGSGQASAAAERPARAER